MSLRVLKLDPVLEQLPSSRSRSLSPRFTFDHWSAKRNCETNCQFLIIKNWSREINKNNQEQKNWEYGVCFVEKFFPVIENRVSIILDNRFRSRRIIKKQLQESIIGNFSCQNLEKQKKKKTLCNKFLIRSNKKHLFPNRRRREDGI